VVFSFFVVAAFANAAETGSVTGRVLNVGSGAYLNNARITVAGGTAEAFTNSFGEYRLANLPVGAVRLAVFHTGLAPLTQEVTVRAGQEARLDFNLARVGAPAAAADGGILKLDVFTVAAQRETNGAAIAINEQRFAPNLKTVVAADEFGEVTEGNVGEFVKFLPGVSVDYVGPDVRSISLRGLPSNYTPVTVDGNRIASASSSNASRVFELEQVSINNVSRVEVTKSPTPDAAADSLAGAVNLISKSAFERVRREFKYRAYLSINDERAGFAATPGPGREATQKIRPGFDFSYLVPVNARFGFVINGLWSEQFNAGLRGTPQWIPAGTTGGGAPVDNPYLARYEMMDGPKLTIRQSVGGTVDFKLGPRDVLSASMQFNYYDAFFGNRILTHDVGTLPTAWTRDFTQGRAGAGSVNITTSFRRKFGGTWHPSLKWRHDGPVWKFDAGGFASNATNKYRDIARGFFENINMRLPNVTVRYEGIGELRPANFVTTTAAGVPINTSLLSSYTINTAVSRPRDSTDAFRGAHANLRRELDFRVPVSLRIGADVRRQSRDIRGGDSTYTFLGRDGIANNADDNASVLNTDPYSAVPPPYGFPSVQWPSTYTLRDLLASNPEYFRLNQVTALQTAVQNSRKLTETVSAAYVRGDVRLINNRLNLVGGVRFERTDGKGEGVLNDPTAYFQKDSAGRLVRDTNGQPIALTNDPAARARLQFKDRGTRAERDYDGYYPSLNGTFNFTDQLLVRAAYARTLGRPDFTNIVPGVVVSDPTSATPNLITVNNTGLRPWQATNWDATIEYYFEPTGVLSLGVFRKDITDFFGSITQTATPALLALYDLDAASYTGYDLRTRLNSGSARITGVDASYKQALTFLPQWARGMQVFANVTTLHLQGSNSADFSNFIPRNYNWGVSLSRPKFTGSLNWNYRGRQKVGAQTGVGVPPGTFRYFAARLYLDANLEVRLFKHLSFFTSARNLTNEPQDDERFAPQTPGYARLFRREQFGVQYAIGVKGTF